MATPSLHSTRDVSRQQQQQRHKDKTGYGAISLSVYGHAPVLDRLEFSYPLKLVAPTPRRLAHHTPTSLPPSAAGSPSIATQIVYVLSYGGGLVGGDCITLDVKVGAGGVLGLSTQGSTKVFKHRSHHRDKLSAAGGDVTRQELHVDIGENGVLLLVPDPVQPFAQSRYLQRQTFTLADATASAMILDWVVSGRPDNGERWLLTSYTSENTIYRRHHPNDERKLLVRDCQTMRSPSLERQMQGYDCLATLLLTGSAFERDGLHLLARFADEERVTASSKRVEQLIWTVVRHRDVTVLKVAGLSSEQVRGWLADVADQLMWRERFGRDAFRAIER